MAEKNDDIEMVEEEGGGKSKMMMIIIIVVVLALAGGGAMMFMGGDDDEVDPDTTTEETEVVAKQTPIYFTLEKPLVANFSDQSKGAVRYIQLKLKVMARDQLIIDAFTLHTPAIQHELLLLLTSQKYDVLSKTSGKKALKTKILSLINKILKKENQTDGLEAVYITNLIMQ